MTTGGIWLVTGASRGVGFGLVGALLLLSGSTVIAAVREFTDSTTKLLHDLPKCEGSRLILVEIDAFSESGATTAINNLRQHHSLVSIDAVIAVAGVNNPRANTLNTTKGSMEDQFRVNAVAPLLLFQSTWRFLSLSKKPKFFVISSIVSSMNLTPQFPHASTAYGASKAALNYIVGRIHQETPTLITGAIHPGWVQTTMGNAAAVAAGMAKAPIPVDDSVQSILSIIHAAERTERSRFVSYDGTDIPW